MALRESSWLSCVHSSWAATPAWSVVRGFQAMCRVSRLNICWGSECGQTCFFTENIKTTTTQMSDISLVIYLSEQSVENMKSFLSPVVREKLNMESATMTDCSSTPKPARNAGKTLSLWVLYGRKHSKQSPPQQTTGNNLVSPPKKKKKIDIKWSVSRTVWSLSVKHQEHIPTQQPPLVSVRRPWFSRCLSMYGCELRTSGRSLPSLTSLTAESRLFTPEAVFVCVRHSPSVRYCRREVGS